MRTIQERQTIQQQLVAAVKSLNLQNALQIINDTGVTLRTRVCEITASHYLGQQADDRLREFCQAHTELNFDFDDYTRGVGMSGDRDYAERLSEHFDADVDWIAAGAAQGGHRAYAEILREQHNADVNWIAKGAALGGHRDYAEILREHHNADVDDIAIGAAQGGHRDYAEVLRTQFYADVNWIAEGAAQGGHRDYAEILRSQFGADVNWIAEGAARGGHLDYAEELRTQHNANVSLIAMAAAQGGHRDYCEMLRTQHNADVDSIAMGAAEGGHRAYAEELITQFGADIRSILRHAPEDYHGFLQNLINQSRASAQAPANGSSRSSSSSGLFSAAAPATPQPSSAGEAKVDSVADYSGLISINLPTNPDLLAQLESRLDVSLKCPITLSVFTQPVMAADGETYEYAAIRQHIESQLNKGMKPTSPCTNAPLADIQLRPNNFVARIINNQLAVFNASQASEDENETPHTGEPKSKRARLL